MINERFKVRNQRLFGTDCSVRNSLHSALDIGDVIWADGAGYLDNLFVLWLALVMDDGAWHLVSSYVPEGDA